MENQPYQFQPSQEPMTPEPEFSRQPKKVWLYVLIGLVVVTLLAGGYYVVAKNQLWWPFMEQQSACTQEAKLCSDGSYVGRTGPNCEFALCPGEVDASNWQTYRNEQYGFEFKYPADWLVIDRKVALSDYLPAGGQRYFVAIYSTSGRQDFDGRVDVYDASLSTTLKENPFLKNRKEVFSDQWVFFRDQYGANYLIEVNGKTYEISGSEELVNKIFPTFKFIEPPICVQVITPARNPQTGEIKDFPTPCEVPEGWEVIK